jgi:peptide/nickel transport system substrate-binding protein
MSEVAPAIHGANEEFIISGAIFNNLVRVDPKLNPQPELASDWKVSDDGKSWTFNLRRGVKFHHGREFTSKDVEFTINRLLNPQTASMGRSLFGLAQEASGTVVEHDDELFGRGGEDGRVSVRLGARIGRHRAPRWIVMCPG